MPARVGTRTAIVFLSCVPALLSIAEAADVAQPAPAALEFFENRIRPLLAERCYKCHGPQKQKSGLRLDSRATLLAGGESGPAIRPGKPGESLLIEAVNYASLEMPPDGMLSKQQIADLTEWVRLGAPWPASENPAPAPDRDTFHITLEDRNYWAFQPVKRPSLPAVRNTGWLSNPIDAFVLSRLEQQGLEPNGAADRRTLLRRVCFDLIGLPPEPDDVAAFLADDSPDAYARVVHRLLERPEYGERWGRHWLDITRFAQTNGYERDEEKPHASRYRDYVIQSFNSDKPYDRFLLEQLAGDELDDVTHESIIATAFYRLGVWDDEPDDLKAAEYEELDEIVRTTGSAFLGLTIGCARCHDHKFDPIPQEEYYQLLAFFRNIEPYGKPQSTSHLAENTDGTLTPLVTPAEFSAWKQRKLQLGSDIETIKRKVESLREPARKRLVQANLAALPAPLQAAAAAAPQFQSEAQQALAKEALAQAAPSDEQIDKELDSRAADELKKLRQQLAELEKQYDAQPFPVALSVREPGPEPRVTRVLLRGNAATPGETVEPGTFRVLGGPPLDPPTEARRAKSSDMRGMLSELGVNESSGLRRALAEWLVTPDHPLTARVIVNRLWQHHFGQGIVATANNFGKAGSPPTHPELLDWLAAELTASGWSLKHVHRLILTSSTYQMSSSSRNAMADRVDPGNSLLWRQNLRRLEAETIRDSMLAVSGHLNRTMQGRGFFPQLSADVLATQSIPGKGWGKSTPQEESRRSVYIFVKRTLMVPLLESFDYTNTAEPLGVRSITTVAPQALLLLNSRFSSEQAERLARRVQADAGEDRNRQITRLYQLALCREPTPDEHRVALELLERQTTQPAAQTGDPASETESTADARLRALRSLCLVVLNLNEFVYVD